MNEQSPQSNNVRLSPFLLGTLIGFFVAAGMLPGGFDAGLFYLRPWWPGTTAPAWIFLVTQPVGILPWPLPWQLLTVVTILGTVVACRVWQAGRWWVAVFSAPMIVNLWLGQIEIFPIAGVALGLLVVQKRASPAWLGLAWLALLNKPQVGTGLALLLAWWVWQERGFRAVLQAGLVAAAIGLITLLLWPGWPEHWLAALRRLNPTERVFNSALFPYGLLAVPLALLPFRVERLRRLRMVAAATLLSSPYFTLYHYTTLVALAERRMVLPLTWLFTFLNVLTPGGIWLNDRSLRGPRLDGLIPVVLLSLDVIAVWRARRARPFERHALADG